MRELWRLGGVGMEDGEERKKKKKKEGNEGVVRGV